MKKKKLFLVLVGLSTLFVSCGSKVESSTSNTSLSEISSDSSEDIKKLNFENVYFEDKIIPYDGEKHVLDEVKGAPENTSIIYSGRSEFTDVGEYEATAKLSKEGYNDKILSAKLKITAIEFSEYKYESKKVTYDGKDHFNDIQIIGFLPEGTITKQEVRNENNEIVTKAIEIGTYSYTCTITNKNYVSKEFKATLTIAKQRKDLPVFASSDGMIYFANGLHSSYLYSYSLTEGLLNLIDYSTPKEFNKYNNNTPVFISNSLFFNSVKEVSAAETNILYTDTNIDDFIKQNDYVYYYSSNSLTASKSGIYKVDASDSNNEPIVTKVFEGKSDNLCIYNDYLYFTNGNDHDYIYKMELTSFTPSLVLKEKVHEFVIHNDKLFCTVNGVVNDYIGYIELNSSSNTLVKLTDSSGEFLSVYDNNLYFNYTDLFGIVDPSARGIYRININTKVKTHLINSEGVNGFDVVSSDEIVYTDITDLHLYKYNISTNQKVDLLNDFTAPEVKPFNTGGKTCSFGNKIYYLNMYAGKTLFVFDETTQTQTQLTSNKVEDFYIYDGVIYFNQVKMLVNNDLYAADLISGSEAVELNSNDIRNIVCDGKYIYATHYNFAGIASGISRMNMDGSEYVKFSEINGAKNYIIKNDRLYYINCSTGQDNGNIEYININDISLTSSKLKGEVLSKEIKNVKQFIFDNNDIFYIYNGTIENSIRRSDFISLGEGTKIASAKTNPNELVLQGDYVYYYSYVATSLNDSGFYRVKKNASEDKTQELICAYDSKYYGSAFAVSESNNLYFLNYIPKLILGDAHFYQIDLNSNNVTKIS